MYNNNLYVYTDESGNSGSNFFDIEQPIFYTSTIISKFDLESECFLEFHNMLLGIAEDNEIHINQLSKDKKILIIKHLVDFIMDNKIEIFFTELEKIHMLKMAFVDYIFDSGLNPEMDPIIYGRRFERLPFALGFAIRLTNEHMRDFFNIFFKTNGNEQAEQLSNLLREIKIQMDEFETHDDLKNLINNSLQFAIENPNIFIDGNSSKVKELLPNVHSILYIMNYLNSFERIGRIEKFWFDESTILKGTGWMREKGMEYHIDMQPFSIIGDTKRTSNIDKSTYKHLDSQKSFGLQIADVFAWLFSKYRNDSLDENIENVVRPILENDNISKLAPFTFNQLVNDVRMHVKILQESSENKEYLE